VNGFFASQPPFASAPPPSLFAYSALSYQDGERTSTAGPSVLGRKESVDLAAAVGKDSLTGRGGLVVSWI
jgi:hypothetical protein